MKFDNPEELAERLDKELGIVTKSLRERASIYKDIPLEALGPEGDQLLLEAKTALVDHTNRAHNDNWETKYPVDQKIEAAVVYSLCGNLGLAARTMKVPVGTVRTWSQSPWWPKALALGRFYKNNQFHAEVSSLADITVNKLTDRISKGQVTTQQLISALKVVGEEKRESERALRGTSEQESATQKALRAIGAELKELTRADKARDITPEKIDPKQKVTVTVKKIEE